MRAGTVGAACAMVLVGCFIEPAATAFAPRPDLMRLGGVEVLLVDTLGVTEAVLPVPDSLAGPFQNGLERVPGQPRDVIVPWQGGDCDVRTTLTLRRLGAGIVISIRTASSPPPGALCTLGGRLNAVVVRFLDLPPALTLDLGSNQLPGRRLG